MNVHVPAVLARAAVQDYPGVASHAEGAQHPDQALFELERKFQELRDHPAHARAYATHTRMLEMVGPPQPSDDPEEREAAYRRASKECGCDAAGQEAEVVCDQTWDVCERIIAMPAHTVEGFAVKARIIDDWYRPELLKYEAEEHDLAEAAIVKLFDQLIAIEPPVAREA